MTIGQLIENGTRYDLVEIARSNGEELVATTGELRRAAQIIAAEKAIVTQIMIVPEFDDNGEDTGRTLVLIDIA
jgi:hypothetical protein